MRIQLQNNALVEHPETVQLRIVAADTTPNDLGDHYDRHAQSRLATLTINDDDAAAATIAIGTNAASTMKFTHSVAENVTNGTYKIPIKVSHSPSVDTTFELAGPDRRHRRHGDGQRHGLQHRDQDLHPDADDDQRHGGRDDHRRRSGWRTTRPSRCGSRRRTHRGPPWRSTTRGTPAARWGRSPSRDDEQRAAKVAFGTAARTTRYTADGEEVVGTLNVPIAINHLPESNTTFTVEVLSTGTARGDGRPERTRMGNPRDFVIGTKTVTFGAATAKSMNLAITIQNDAVEEDDEYHRPAHRRQGQPRG